MLFICIKTKLGNYIGFDPRGGKNIQYIVFFDVFSLIHIFINIQNNIMMKNRIKLTGSDLQRIVEEAVTQTLLESSLDEGWFGDKWNQARSAAGTMFGSGNGSLRQRVQNTKKNWDT